VETLHAHGFVLDVVTNPHGLADRGEDELLAQRSVSRHVRGDVDAGCERVRLSVVLPNLIVQLLEERLQYQRQDRKRPQ
jgi:hypothetical protein